VFSFFFGFELSVFQTTTPLDHAFFLFGGQEVRIDGEVNVIKALRPALHRVCAPWA